MSLPDIFFNILENSKELDRLRKEQEIVFVEINKMHKKLKASESLSLYAYLFSLISDAPSWSFCNWKMVLLLLSYLMLELLQCDLSGCSLFFGSYLTLSFNSVLSFTISLIEGILILSGLIKVIGFDRLKNKNWKESPSNLSSVELMLW